MAWVDGSSGHDGSGGWAAVLLWDRPNGTTKRRILKGGTHGVTNQQMEMLAVIMALRALRPGTAVTIYSDSAYVVNCWQQDWIARWRRKGWRAGRGKPVANREYWETMESLVVLHDVTWVKVPGHAGVAGNELADHHARNAREAYKRDTAEKRRKKGRGATPAGTRWRTAGSGLSEGI
jgi:ribonuclease HI